MKKLLLSLLLAIPMVASATGMGVYIPFNITETEELEYDSISGTYDFKYKPSAGFGIVFDSNIGKDKLYNYRFSFEYSSTELDTINGYTLSDTLTKDKFNFVNTFGFGVLRTKTVRLWVGPRINIQFENGQYKEIDQISAGVGIAAVLGVNVNLGRTVSLSADLDYHAVSVAGTEESLYFSEDYTAINKGVTARFYVLFRFGETFKPKQKESIIDYSL